MKQYIDLLKTIEQKGTIKPAARENMPGTNSLFGYQFIHDLEEGFPLLTTKKMYWKGIVLELLWFLQGDTNITYLVENGVKIWNEDAFNYYCNLKAKFPSEDSIDIDLERFVEIVKEKGGTPHSYIPNYKWGDCGHQYGKVWRDWSTHVQSEEYETLLEAKSVDQIKNLIDSLKNNPQSRRHLVTAIDPINSSNLALYWCHAMFQFNCRPIDLEDRKQQLPKTYGTEILDQKEWTELCDDHMIPAYKLDCQLYQRSADVILGVPFNIASYALLTHILCKIANMVPGNFIHSFGDVHVYDNHSAAFNTNIGRTPTKLPSLELSDDVDWMGVLEPDFNYNYLMEALVGYDPQPAIEAELSTGLKK